MRWKNGKGCLYYFKRTACNAFYIPACFLVSLMFQSPSPPPFCCVFLTSLLDLKGLLDLSASSHGSFVHLLCEPLSAGFGFESSPHLQPLPWVRLWHGSKYGLRALSSSVPVAGPHFLALGCCSPLPSCDPGLPVSAHHKLNLCTT